MTAVSADQAQSAEERSRRLTAIGLMMLALLCFTALDTTAKVLTAEMPALQVTYVRYLVHFVLAVIVLNPWTVRDAWTTRRPWTQLLRGLCLFGSTFANFMALKTLQLDQTISIIFATPLLIALLAGPILGEWIGPRRWAAVLVGFLGVLVVTRPGFGTFDPGMLWSFGGVIFYAVYSITTRVLSGVDSPSSMLVISAAIPVALLTPVVPFTWVMPTAPSTWALMLLVGTCGAVGHFFFIRAYGRAPAPVLAPFVYTQIVWMVLSGWLVFGDVPGPWTLVGAGIVIASGLYLLARERKVKGEATSTTG